MKAISGLGKSHSSSNSSAQRTASLNQNGNSQGIVAGGCNKPTPELKLPGADKPDMTRERNDQNNGAQDQTDISKECQDENCKDPKCDKDGKEKSPIEELLEAMKAMFDEQKDDEKDKSPCGGGGGSQGGGSCGGGGGGCGKAGGANTDPSQGGKDPLAQLEDLVKAVESAKDPSAKKEAQDKLKKHYDKLKECETEIPDELRNRVEKALRTEAPDHSKVKDAPKPVKTTA